MTVYAIIGGTGLTRLEGLSIHQSLPWTRLMALRRRISRRVNTPGARCCFWRATVIRIASRRIR